MPALLKEGGTYTFQQHDADFIAAVAQVTAGIAGFVASSILPGLPEFAGRDDFRALDLGCGMGGTLLALARAYPKAELLGVDIEPRSVEQANARFAEAGLAQRVTARLGPTVPARSRFAGNAACTRHPARVTPPDQPA